MFNNELSFVRLDDNNNYSISVVAVGFDKEEIDIRVIDSFIVIKSNVKEDDPRFMKFEFGYKYKLDSTMNTDEIEASLDKGILTVVIPRKKVDDYSKKIDIK